MSLKPENFQGTIPGLLLADFVIRGDDIDCEDGEFYFFGHIDRMEALKRSRYYLGLDAELRGMRTSHEYAQGWCCELAKDHPQDHEVEPCTESPFHKDYDYFVLVCGEDDPEAVGFTRVWWES